MIASGLSGFWETRPLLPFHLVDTYVAWWTLDSDRQVSFTVGKIPFSSIDAFARRHDIEDEEFDYLLRFLRHMDDVYLRWNEAEREKKAKQDTAESGATVVPPAEDQGPEITG